MGLDPQLLVLYFLSSRTSPKEADIGLAMVGTFQDGGQGTWRVTSPPLARTTPISHQDPLSWGKERNFLL